MDDIQEQSSPAAMYNAFGQFDPVAYASDLEHFPEYFDSNGWPLFGAYDPATLTHPITGKPWYVSPRVPLHAELGSDYADWYAFAVRFNDQLSSLRKYAQKVAMQSLPTPPTEVNGKAVFSERANIAAAGNISFLIQQVVPELEALLALRSNSVRISVLWGEFLIHLERFSRLARLPKQRQEGKKQNRQAQLKWFLHWLRHYESQHRTARVAKKDFVEVTYDLATGVTKAPLGFGRDWFLKACGEIRNRVSDPTTGRIRTDVIPKRGLLNSLRRPDPALGRQLLASPPDEEPLIPPVGRAAYSEK